MIELVRILVEAGVTPVSAVRAAVVLDQGGSIELARREIEYADEPAIFDAQLLLAELNRERAPVAARANA